MPARNIRTRAKRLSRLGRGTSRRETCPDSMYTAFTPLGPGKQGTRHSPAVFTSAEIPLVAAASSALRPVAPLWRASFVDHQGPTHHCPTVASLDCLVR